VFAFDRRNESCFCSVCIEDPKSIDICENENSEYVEAWRHTKLNIKGKIQLASSKDMESNATIVSVDGNGINRSSIIKKKKLENGKCPKSIMNK
jgi:hypothetical protein